MSTHPPRVLVVEDSDDLRELFGQFLDAVGWEVHMAVDGKMALDVLAHQEVDILLSDIQMPSMNGFDLLEVVKRDYPNTEVVLMSGHCAADDPLLEGIGVPVLWKPISPSTLDEALRDALKEAMKHRS